MVLDYLGSYGVLGNTFLQYASFIAILVATAIVAKVAFKIFKGVVRKAAEGTKTQIDDVLVDSVESPVVIGIVLAGIYAALNILTLPETFITKANTFLKVLIFLDATWLVSKAAMDIIENFIKPVVEKAQPEMGEHFIYLVKRVTKIIIWVLGILFVVSNLGYDISTIIAGLGIGGVAIALAVKDLLSNIFGGVTVITDMPFKVGDRIRVANIDGTVTEIGVRSTKIKSLDGTQYIVPNSKMIDSVIENVSREKARKIKFTIGVEYGTSNAKLKKAKKIIEDIVKKNKATDDKSIVYFTSFGDFSLNILVIYYIKDLKNILPVKDEINFKIKEAFEKAKIEMAFPTQTLHVKK
jgi:MscS family membrane protein